MTDYLIALFLGFVEGLTEFIPVSSTAHLILLVKGLHFPNLSGDVFEVVIQIGAIFAVMVLYREKIIHTIRGIFTDKTAQRFALNVIIGTIPALILGALLHDFIKTVLYNPMIIAAALIVGGIIILLFDKKFDHPTVDDIDNIAPRQALLIGVCQSLALVPGVSRSGATIIGSLALGLSRTAATEFSFFLAIPIMFCAVGYDLFKNREALMTDPHLGLLGAGLAASFVTALIIVKTMVGFVSKHGFAPFAWYRLVLGLVTFYIFW